MYKIYNKGNYTALVKKDTNETFYGVNRGDKSVYVIKNSLNRSIYRIYGIQGVEQGLVLKIGELFDRDDVPYTEETFEEFYENFNLGGATPQYDLTPIVTRQVGALEVGTDITGLTWQQVVELMITDYPLPTFSSFSIQGITNLIEVGTNISGVRNFLFNTTNSFNIESDTVIITNSNNSQILIDTADLSSPKSLDVGTVDNNAPINQTFNIRALNTKGGAFQRNFNIVSIYPYFFGKSSSLPTVGQTLINGGTKVLQDSNGTINISFGANNEFIWFAIPQLSTSKTRWFVDIINQGGIGSTGDLFEGFVLQAIDSPTTLWSGVNYKFYISAYTTTTSGTMQLRNS